MPALLPFLVACLHPGVHDAELEALNAPNDPAAWDALAAAYDRAGRHGRATAAWQHALTLDATDEAAKAGVGGHPPAALRKAERLTLKNPGEDEVWGDLADQQRAMGMTDTAQETYLHALRLDPSDNEWQQDVLDLTGVDAFFGTIDELLPDSETDDEAVGNRADAYLLGGNRAEACSLYEKALRIDPTDAEWTQQVATCNGEDASVASVLGEIGGEVGGEVDGTGGWGIIGTGPTEGSVAKELGIRAATEGDRKQALNGLWTALVADPTDLMVRTLYVAVSGESELAVLEKLVLALPASDEAWGDLGDERLANGNRAGALEAYKQASALDASDEEWSTKLTVLGQFL